MKKLFKIFFFLILLCGCQQYYNPVTQKEEYTFYSEKDEIEIGNAIDQKLCRENKILPVPENVKKILEKIAIVCDRPSLNYTLKIIENEEINAFGIPGGYIYLYSGLVENIKNEDEIAFVIAHEIGHICARDGIQRLEKTILYSIPASILLGSEKNKAIKQTIDLGFNISMLKYSREQELRADTLAVKYIYKAGYTPERSIEFLERLKEFEKKDPTKYLIFLRDHPIIEERIKNIEKTILELRTFR